MIRAWVGGLAKDATRFADSWSLYGYIYTQNSPINFFDITGRDTTVIFNLNGGGSSDSSNGGSSSASSSSGCGGLGHVGLHVDGGYLGGPLLYDPGGSYPGIDGSGQTATGAKAAETIKMKKIFTIADAALLII